MKALLCHLFGHRGIGRGWWGDGLYGRVTGGYTDGTGVSHYQVNGECDRCGTTYVMARFHGNDVSKVRG